MFKPTETVKMFVYKATADGDKKSQSWNVYPSDNRSEFTCWSGTFIKGKPYVCEPSEKEPGKIKVSGFFNMIFTTTGYQMGSAWGDKKTKAKRMGYYSLFFDVADCKRFLKFDHSYTMRLKKRSFYI